MISIHYSRTQHGWVKCLNIPFSSAECMTVLFLYWIISGVRIQWRLSWSKVIANFWWAIWNTISSFSARFPIGGERSWILADDNKDILNLCPLLTYVQEYKVAAKKVRDFYLNGKAIGNDTLSNLNQMMSDIRSSYGINLNARVQAAQSNGRTFMSRWSMIKYIFFLSKHNILHV